MSLYYVRHDRVGGVIIEADSRLIARRAINFGGMAGESIVRLATSVDRAWWHGALLPSDHYPRSNRPREQFLRRMFHIPATVSIYSAHPSA